MFLPGVLTRQTVEVEPYEGSGAYGETYGAKRTVQCRRDNTRRVVRDADGNEVVSEVTLWVRADEVLHPEDRVTLPTGHVTRVLASKAHQGLSRTAEREVTLA